MHHRDSIISVWMLGESCVRCRHALMASWRATACVYFGYRCSVRRSEMWLVGAENREMISEMCAGSCSVLTVGLLGARKCVGFLREVGRVTSNKTD